MSRPIITFTSDFGLQDWFVAVVQGVLHGIAPEARIVDLNHMIPPGHIERAAFVLEAATPDFPVGTVHLAVIDPSVGTTRRAIAVAARGHFFVGPDNGLFEWALADPNARVHELRDTRYFREPVSRTFHGRDVFAPVAAHIANGEPLERFGPAVRDPVRLDLHAPRRRDGELVGRVMFVDRFGNCLTNLTDTELGDAFAMVQPERLDVIAAGRIVHGLARSYGDAETGALLAIVGSSGRLEIAQVGGDAAERLGLGIGDEIRVRVRG
jgi:S-adenosyl-L-methionine hydrolase (adenosine-forming)